MTSLSEREEIRLWMTLDSLFNAGVEYSQLEKTAKRLGLNWRITI